MKVLFISTWFPNRIYPKNGNFVERHAECVANFAELTVLNIQYDTKLKGMALEVCQVQKADYRLLVVYYGLPRRFGVLAKFFQLIRAYRTGLKRLCVGGKLDVDLLHAHVIIHAGLVAKWISRRTGIPYLLTEHSSIYTKEDPNAAKGIKRWLSRWAASDARFVLPVSKALAESMKAMGLKGTYRTIPNVVDTERFRPRLDQKPETPFTFLHISNFIPQVKNEEGILQAAKQLWDAGAVFRLIIAGDGELAPLQAYAKAIGCKEDGLDFLGPLTEDEVADLMQAAHCFVLFSNHETQSCVLLEAQSCGLPVIASRVGGVVEIVDHESLGILVPPKDIQQLLEAMQHMMADYVVYNPAHIRQVALARYSIAEVQRQLEAAYQFQPQS